MHDKISESNQSRFDREAATWDEEPRRVELAAALAKALTRELSLDGTAKALEFGCGTGLVTLGVAPQLRSLLAVDVSDGMLSVLRQKVADRAYAHVQVRQMDLSREPLPEQDFDLIFSCMTLHHIADTAGLVKKLVQGLAPGGRLAIADLVKEDGSFHKDNTGVMHPGFDLQELRSMWERLGLERVRSVTAHTVLKPRDPGAEQAFPVFLMTGRKPVRDRSRHPVHPQPLP